METNTPNIMTDKKLIHFRPSNENVSACGIECPEISAYDGRDVDCAVCRKTKAWKRYMGRDDEDGIPKKFASREEYLLWCEKQCQTIKSCCVAMDMETITKIINEIDQKLYLTNFQELY